MTEPDANELLTVAQAMSILDATPAVPRIATVALEEAQGLRLAADVVADRDYPPFDKSQMDGIACLAADAAEVGRDLEVIGEIPAGSWPHKSVAPGQAMRIMTGAPLPSGADTVVPVEFLDSTTDRCRVMKPVKAGNAVARRASEVTAGQVVLRRGTLLQPAPLAVAATVGAAIVDVFDRPRVAVLTTGDEVVPFTESPGPAQIRNANSLLLSSLLYHANCDVTDLGIAPDRPDVLRAALRDGLAYDVFFVTGGMSMGDYDYVPALLGELGVDLKITKIKIKPGKPFVFGTLANADTPSSLTHVFGLPGNPVSSFVCTTLLALRLIARLTGSPPAPRMYTRTLATPLPPNGPREFYQPVRVDGDLAHPLAWKGSADVFTLATANALLCRPESQPALPAGAPLQVLPFADFA